MWTYTIAPILMLLAIFAIIFAIPVCLGVLLRLLIRKSKPSLVAWFGAALLLGAWVYLAGDRNPVRSVSDFPPESWILLAIVADVALGLFLPFCGVFIFVNWGVEIVDRKRKAPNTTSEDIVANRSESSR